MRLPLSNQSGVTLIELLVGISILAIVLTAATSLYVMTLRTSLENKLVQELQREADAVQAHLSQNLKEAVAVDSANSNFTTNPNTLQVNLSAGGLTRRYYVTGQQLYYRNESGVDTNLLTPGTTITSFLVTPTSSATNELVALQVRGTLQRARYGQTKQFTLGTTIHPRPQ